MNLRDDYLGSMRWTSSALLLIIFVLVSAAKCQNTGGETCDEVVTIKDFSELDGCGFILVTKEGKKLLPVNLDEYAVELTDGQKTTASYEVLEGAASICMSEDAIVRLHCFGIVAAGSEICPPIVDPFEIDWSRDIMKEIDPIRVEEQIIRGRRIYHFIGNTEGRLLSCTGELLCSYPMGQQSICSQYMDASSTPKLIYILDQAP